MKKWSVLFAIILGVGAAGAQPAATNTPPAKITAGHAKARTEKTDPGRTNAPSARAAQSSLQAQKPGVAAPALPWFRPAKPNELTAGKLTYSGVIVQAIKAKNPLQLINPAAPASYGSGQDNVVNFSFSGTGPMIKIFSIDF